MSDPALLLLPSPLSGPHVWQPVADRLRVGGHRVAVAALPPDATSVDLVLEGYLAAVPDGPVVLVPHSNAGLYVAPLASARGDDVRGVVFCDALLPGRGERTPTTSSDFRAFLSTRADEHGLLPPWSRWWPEADVAGLLPDPAGLEALRAGEPRLPLGYFDEAVPTPAGWDARPTAYLSFGDGYAEERAEAARRGWPRATLDGLHLHPLVDPDEVAGAVVGLLRRLGFVKQFP